MTLKQIAANQRRLVAQYKSCLTTRNTIIDSFEKEFNRHVKLVCKKQDYKTLPIGHELRDAVKESLRKSRNMKRIQADMDIVKARIRAAQTECRNNKRLYVATQSAISNEESQENFKNKLDYKRAVVNIEKFEIRNEQRAKTSK